jgi:hypothetical protein
MFRLGMYDTWYDWTYINEAPKRVMGVTADDVRRVVNEYLDPKTRTAAIYLTKETEEQTDVPPDEEAEFALLMEPLAPEVQERFRSWVDRMQTMEASQLEPWAALVEAAMDERPVPEQQKPAIEYMVRKMRERAEELKAAEEAKKAPQGNEQGE